MFPIPVPNLMTMALKVGGKLTYDTGFHLTQVDAIDFQGKKCKESGIPDFPHAVWHHTLVTLLGRFVFVISGIVQGGGNPYAACKINVQSQKKL